MSVALVHDQLFEYGGAERVLEALWEIYPEAALYTAWVDWQWLKKNKPEWQNKKIITSWFDKVPAKKFLASPLRFLAPWIWESFDFSNFDLVISSSAWYMSKGIITKPETLHLCYCHTPPRYLYGYSTAREFGRFWWGRAYAVLVNPCMRFYDYLSSQRVDYFVCNSREVQRRISKFYRREAEVIYPPINKSIKNQKSPPGAGQAKIKNTNKILKIKGHLRGEVAPAAHLGGGKEYFLMVNRLVRPKNVDLAIKACRKMKIHLVIVGEGSDRKRLEKIADNSLYIHFTGYVDDGQLADLYTNCRAVLYLAEEEDFGITPVEAMAFGKPVIAFRSGGVKESVIDGKTGIFINELRIRALLQAMQKLKKLNISPSYCQQQAEKFSKERFKKEIEEFVLSKKEKFSEGK